MGYYIVMANIKNLAWRRSYETLGLADWARQRLEQETGEQLYILYNPRTACFDVLSQEQADGTLPKLEGPCNE